MFEEMPVVTLSNGLRVGNFSSPHSFEFEDGTVLKACSKERAQALSCEFVETLTPGGGLPNFIGSEEDSRYQNVSLEFKLSQWVFMVLWKTSESYDIDVVLVPLSMLQVFKKAMGGNLHKARTIRRVSRIDKRICIDKFGI